VFLWLIVSNENKHFHLKIFYTVQSSSWNNKKLLFTNEKLQGAAFERFWHKNCSVVGVSETSIKEKTL